MKTVFLDYRYINFGDLSWKPFEDICDFESYYYTEEEELESRLADADVVAMDSYVIDKKVMDAALKLRLILPAATGYNNVDLEEAKRRGIAVANVPAYSTDAVAQHAIALLLGLANSIEPFNDFSRSWAKGQKSGTTADVFVRKPMTLLAGKSIGIVGYGNIGKKVAQIAKALGMKVNVYSQNPDEAVKSDVVSLHCPLTAENTGMVDRSFIEKMKDGAILINTARGDLVDEKALADALKNGKLAGAGLDVTAVEPLGEDSPLIDCENCLITPHVAFMPVETRQKVIDISAENLRSFMEGGDLNRII